MPKPAEPGAPLPTSPAGSARPAHLVRGSLSRRLAVQAGFWAAFMLLDLASSTFRMWAGTPAWYLPAGLSLAMLVWGGMRYVPVVLFAGVTAAVFNYHRGLFSWAGLPGTAAMTLAYVGGAAWLRKVWHLDLKLSRLRDVGGLALFLAVGVLPAALVGVLALLGDGLVGRPDFARAVFNWWLGDSISVASFTPFLLLHAAPRLDAFLGATDFASQSSTNFPWEIGPQAVFEAVVELAGIALAIWLVFGFGPAIPYQPLYVLFFPVIWMAVRHGQPAAVVAVLMVNVGLMLAAHVTRPDVTALPRLQLVMLALAVTGLCLGAVASGRSLAEAALRSSREELQTVMASIPDYLWSGEFDSQGRWTYRYYSSVVEKITGRPPEFFLQGPEAWISTVHPEDRPRMLKSYEGLRTGQAVHDDQEYRILLPDGTVRWVLDSATARPQGGVTRVDGVVGDITQRKLAEDEARRAFEHLRALAAHLESIREEERKRVARDIHDQLGQALTALKIDLTALLRGLPADLAPQARNADSILKLIGETIQSVRRIASELRPGILDDLGLVAAVEWAAEEFQSRTGTECRLDLPADDLAVDPDQATAIFRILQETLTNVARHASAARVDVRLARSNGDLVLEVCDDGIGIPEGKLSQDQSLGILGMRERATLLGGDLAISSVWGQGTTVTVRIPEARRT